MSLKTYDDLDGMAGDNIIDSRDLIAALYDYDLELDNVDEEDPDDMERVAEIKEEYGELAEEVRSLADEVGGDWPYGVMMILESHFEDYARQYADDIGAVNSEIGWPYGSIDWEKAASELAMDYTSVSFGGYDYYVRA